jgi:hypothetical protein
VGAAIYDARPAPGNHPNSIACACIGGWHLGGRVDSCLCEDSICFCGGMDPKEDHMFLLTSVHELAHFVGDKPGGALPILDQGHTDQPGYNQLGPRQRLTNADTYANCVGEFFFGSMRFSTRARSKESARTISPLSLATRRCSLPRSVLTSAISTGKKPMGRPRSARGRACRHRSREAARCLGA